MGDALDLHRLQFAFTIVFHYLFPQLTMGLAPLVLLLKWRALKTGEPVWNDAARFWARLFGLNFAFGVVTGIPMELQLGANWARFTQLTGGVVGQTLAMEGVFAFFLESSFLYVLIWGEKKVSPKVHFASAVALFVGSWLSGYFIIVTNAFMQHPVGHVVGENGRYAIASLGTYLTNPWALAQYAHNQLAALVTASFAMTAVGAYWSLRGVFAQQASLALKVGTTAGLVATVLVAFPTGDFQAKLVARHQPASLAAMEGRFESGPYAEIAVLGQPNVREKRLDNKVAVPAALSFLAHGHFASEVRGLDEFPRDEWPTNIELLYYAFHVMVGLGTLFIGLTALANLLRWRGRLERTRPMLWALLLAFPFPYVANTAGWMTAELGRQPWLVHGLLRTAQGHSPTVHAGSTTFSLLGFLGLAMVLLLTFVLLVTRTIAKGPTPDGGHAHA